VVINSALETIRENIEISAKESLGCYEMKKRKPRFRKMLNINRTKETSQTAVVTGS
jgi:hypothetical protein